MSRTPLQPLRRVAALLRKADKRLFDLIVRWPTLTDDQIARAVVALDADPAPAQLPAQPSPRRSDGPVSVAIAEAEARLQRIKEDRERREASRWWQRRLRADGLSLPFATWTVFTRDGGGEWVPAGACADRTSADRVAVALTRDGCECALVSWDRSGAGRLVPPG